MRERFRSPAAVAGTLAGVALIFVALWLGFLRLPGRDPVPPAPGREPPEAILREVRERDRERLATYGWVDREKGIVRIPIEAAMDRLIEERGR